MNQENDQNTAVGEPAYQVQRRARRTCRCDSGAWENLGGPMTKAHAEAAVAGWATPTMEFQVVPYAGPQDREQGDVP